MLNRPDSLSFFLFVQRLLLLFFSPNHSECTVFCRLIDRPQCTATAQRLQQILRQRIIPALMMYVLSLFFQYFVWFRRLVKSIKLRIKRENRHVLEPMRCRTQCQWKTCLLRNRNMSRIHQLWLLHILLLISRLIWIRLNFSILFISHHHPYHHRSLS